MPPVLMIAVPAFNPLMLRFRFVEDGSKFKVEVLTNDAVPPLPCVAPPETSRWKFVPAKLDPLRKISPPS